MLHTFIHEIQHYLFIYIQILQQSSLLSHSESFFAGKRMLYKVELIHTSIYFHVIATSFLGNKILALFCTKPGVSLSLGGYIISTGWGRNTKWFLKWNKYWTERWNLLAVQWKIDCDHQHQSVTFCRWPLSPSLHFRIQGGRGVITYCRKSLGMASVYCQILVEHVLYTLAVR